jgi:hypothetical protein
MLVGVHEPKRDETPRHARTRHGNEQANDAAERHIPALHEHEESYDIESQRGDLSGDMSTLSPDVPGQYHAGTGKDFAYVSLQPHGALVRTIYEVQCYELQNNLNDMGSE